ncbi:DUF1990 family protein [Streptomyces bambusae]|uniref:DUF1990 family protein n=1 Tax=Streptomyces bambusae TaxID=1550616 RepID=A0ABS6YYF0_9ACTN|nr:DUF1990 family protein [Streptomyces bambusae]
MTRLIGDGRARPAAGSTRSGTGTTHSGAGSTHPGAGGTRPDGPGTPGRPYRDGHDGRDGRHDRPAGPGLRRSSGPNYPDRGATARRPLPDGYHHLHHRAAIGRGQAVFEAAGTAVTTLAMHRATGFSVRADHASVRPGTRVEIDIGFGPLRINAPCEVVWTAYAPDRAGFAYGTLAGHPEAGEESFTVELAADGTVWFEVTAFSRPGVWYTRLAGPLVPFLQLRYARWCTRILRGLAARG